MMVRLPYRGFAQGGILREIYDMNIEVEGERRERA